MFCRAKMRLGLGTRDAGNHYSRANIYVSRKLRYEEKAAREANWMMRSESERE